jgi:peptidoglycan/xylan/chitin deacetylase (PgdA/CDA1 family)
MSTSQIQADLKRTSRAIAKATGRAPNAFRPPYGATNNRVKQAAAAIGLRQVMWNACPDVGVTSPSVMLKQTLRYVDIAKRNGVGATVLLHDGSGPRGSMLEMLPTLIDRLRDRGWRFVRYT